MIQTCSKCKNYDISISDEPCRECQKAFRRGDGKPNFVPALTNADRIRAMSIEELAKQLAAEQIAGARSFLHGFDNELEAEYVEEVKKAWPEIIREKLEWLKQEAKDG